MPPKAKQSERDGKPRKTPVVDFCRMVWKQQGHQMSHSWYRLNSSMSEALNLCVEAGFPFELGDVTYLMENFRGGYWLHAEQLYGRAVAGAHGINMSACLDLEQRFGRKPYIFKTTETPAGKRIHVGFKFFWKGEIVTCTSFAEDSSSLTACSYKPRPEGSYSNVIKKRYTITNEALAEANKIVTASVKASKKKQEAPAE